MPNGSTELEPESISRHPIDADGHHPEGEWRLPVNSRQQPDIDLIQARRSLRPGVLHWNANAVDGADDVHWVRAAESSSEEAQVGRVSGRRERNGDRNTPRSRDRRAHEDWNGGLPAVGGDADGEERPAQPGPSPR